MSSRLRCAIYTRKSSEEGLDQNFNSLQAQREACEAYVLSQTGEGWSAIKTEYDDGGYSGGSIERPALKKLMADIRGGLVDIVVVYKVDRLTRSLADFAKIVELFDAKGVSFASITQAFNTTSSMGRLTLNVLLSFAQFEREVTGERIRDKVAASKAKGMRMGGRPPLGYDIVEGRLAVNEPEAERVRSIFTRYLEVGSLQRLERTDVEGKRWVSQKGSIRGGGHLGRGALHYLLTNPAYRGVTRHHDKRYPDTHPAIVPVELWDQVQAKLLDANASQPNTPRFGEAAHLAGKLTDDRGNAMVVVHTKRGVTRYRYYLSRAKLTGNGEPGSIARISAGVIEGFLTEQIAPLIAAAWRPEAPEVERALQAIENAQLSEGEVVLQLEPSAIRPDAQIDTQAHRIPFHMQRRQGAMILQAPGAQIEPAGKLDRALVRAIVLARGWAEELETGCVASIKALANREKLCSHYATRLLPLAYLAPDLTEQVLAGRQPRHLTLKALTERPLPIGWDEQRRVFAGRFP